MANQPGTFDRKTSNCCHTEPGRSRRRNLTVIDAHTVRAGWTDATGATLAKEFPTEREAIVHITK